MDLAELFGEKPKAKASKSMATAQFLRFLASLIDTNEETTDTVKGEEATEVLTRPHFTPSGGM